MSLHSDILSWIRANQPLLLLLHDAPVRNKQRSSKYKLHSLCVNPTAGFEYMIYRTCSENANCHNITDAISKILKANMTQKVFFMLFCFAPFTLMLTMRTTLLTVTTAFAKHYWVWFRFMVFSATFNNITVISWRSVLLVEEIRVPGEYHRPVTSQWQTLSHVVVSSTPRH